GRRSRRRAAARSATARGVPSEAAWRARSSDGDLARPDEPAAVQVVGGGGPDGFEENVLERGSSTLEHIEDHARGHGKRYDPARGRLRIRYRDEEDAAG